MNIERIKNFYTDAAGAQTVEAVQVLPFGPRIRAIYDWVAQTYPKVDDDTRFEGPNGVKIGENSGRLMISSGGSWDMAGPSDWVVLRGDGTFFIQEDSEFRTHYSPAAEPIYGIPYSHPSLLKVLQLLYYDAAFAEAPLEELTLLQRTHAEVLRWNNRKAVAK